MALKSCTAMLMLMLLALYLLVSDCYGVIGAHRKHVFVSESWPCMTLSCLTSLGLIPVLSTGGSEDDKVRHCSCKVCLHAHCDLLAQGS
jgi:hypothetical protein